MAAPWDALMAMDDATAARFSPERDAADGDTPTPATAHKDEEHQAKSEISSVDAVGELLGRLNARAQEEDPAERSSDTQPSEVAKPGDEPIVQQLHAAVADGKVDVRSGLGQRFTLHLRSHMEDREAFEALKGQKEANRLKAEFRLRWARSELDARTVVKRSKAETQRDTCGEKGRYMTLDRLIEQEGGMQNPAAIQRATAYAEAAMKRGAPFVLWNSWKQCSEILVLERIRDCTFEQKCSMERTVDFFHL